MLFSSSSSIDAAFLHIIGERKMRRYSWKNSMWQIENWGSYQLANVKCLLWNFTDFPSSKYIYKGRLFMGLRRTESILHIRKRILFSVSFIIISWIPTSYVKRFENLQNLNGKCSTHTAAAPTHKYVVFQIFRSIQERPKFCFLILLNLFPTFLLIRFFSEEEEEKCLACIQNEYVWFQDMRLFCIKFVLFVHLG